MLARNVVFVLVSATLMWLAVIPILPAPLDAELLMSSYVSGLVVLFVSQGFWIPVTTAGRQRTRLLRRGRAAVTLILGSLVGILVILGFNEGWENLNLFFSEPLFYILWALISAVYLVTLMAIPIGLHAAVGMSEAPLAARTQSLLTTYSFIGPAQASRAKRGATKALVSSPLDVSITAMPPDLAATVLDLRARAGTLRGLNSLILVFISPGADLSGALHCICWQDRIE